MRVKNLIIPVLLFFAAADFSHAQTDYRYAPASKDPSKKMTVIGRMRMHTVKTGETLLDIARHYGLGFSELKAFYPEKDPWLLEEGSQLQIPALWIVPPTKRRAIVINVPEMRLYQFHPKKGTVSTYPVTVGEEETPTPLGTFRIVDKEIDPEWNIPRKLQYKYNKKIVQAGDDNPIGKYWLGFLPRGYGIHGTDNPWSVGRILSNGCIRLYPEDIERLFPDVPKGTVVEIIYEPVKFGFRGQGHLHGGSRRPLRLHRRYGAAHTHRRGKEGYRRFDGLGEDLPGHGLEKWGSRPGGYPAQGKWREEAIKPSLKGFESYGYRLEIAPRLFKNAWMQGPRNSEERGVP